MKLAEKTQRTSELIARLLSVWERSVKATHTFLSGEEIAKIKPYVPQALEQVPHLIVLEDESGVQAAFMGIGEQKLEMLFLARRSGERDMESACFNTGLSGTRSRK